MQLLWTYATPVICRCKYRNLHDTCTFNINESLRGKWLKLCVHVVKASGVFDGLWLALIHIFRLQPFYVRCCCSYTFLKTDFLWMKNWKTNIFIRALITDFLEQYVTKNTVCSICLFWFCVICLLNLSTNDQRPYLAKHLRNIYDTWCFHLEFIEGETNVLPILPMDQNSKILDLFNILCIVPFLYYRWMLH
jgi:hypothetical protein